MKIKSLISDLSASTVDHTLTRFHSALYFLIISYWLSKSELGIYAWCLSLATYLARALTLGANDIITRRISAEAQAPALVAGVAISQRIFLSACLLAAALPIALPLQSKIPHFNILLLAYLALVFRQYVVVSKSTLMGSGKFWGMAIANQCGMLLKMVAGIASVWLGFGVPGLFAAMIMGTALQGIIGYSLAARVIPGSFLPRWDAQELKALLREGLPLFVLSAFNQALARADWFLMGIMRADSEVGEYAFAYRVFEFCWLPHIIIATIFLPKISALLKDKGSAAKYRGHITEICRWVAAVAALIPLNMIISWTPVIDFLTAGKYGEVNQTVITILCISAPLTASVSILWIVFVALLRSRQLMVIIMSVTIFNILINLVLIPKYGGSGAAVAATLAQFGQFFAYLAIAGDKIQTTKFVRTVGLIFFWAALAIVAAGFLDTWWWLKTLLGTGIYILGMALSAGLSAREFLEKLTGDPSARLTG